MGRRLSQPVASEACVSWSKRAAASRVREILPGLPPPTQAAGKGSQYNVRRGEVNYVDLRFSSECRGATVRASLAAVMLSTGDEGVEAGQQGAQMCRLFSQRLRDY